MKFRSIQSSVAIATLLIAAACGGSEGPKSKTTTMVEPYEPGADVAGLEEDQARVERLGDLYSQLGDSADAAALDCDRATTSINVWVATNRGEVKKLNAELTAMPKARARDLAPTLEEPMRRAALQLRDLSTRCKSHEPLFDAISSLQM